MKIVIRYDKSLSSFDKVFMINASLNNLLKIEKKLNRTRSATFNSIKANIIKMGYSFSVWGLNNCLGLFVYRAD